MSRLPLLLLPGLLCDGGLWRAQIAAVADLAAVTVADLTLDDSIEAMTNRALNTMPERFAVAGMSMGGYVALPSSVAPPREFKASYCSQPVPGRTAPSRRDGAARSWGSCASANSEASPRGLWRNSSTRIE